MKSLNKEIPCHNGYTRYAKAILLGYKLVVIAARDILPGEEIFYYYGDQYWYPIVHTKVKATKSYGKKKIKKFSENIANEIKITFANPVLMDP
jgi:SET domain-containing protein